jgi:SAM-dependent methyltransferase
MELGARTVVIRSLLPQTSNRLLDVGCGPINADYPYADKAARVTCVDWNLKASGTIPQHVECLDGDFTRMDLAPNSYDSIIAADVFEHIPLEQEQVFVEKCVASLRPGGNMVVSVPHQGTFACLDPYQVKPAIHRILSRFHLYKLTHNGCCDIRKGHKHYGLPELTGKFSPLEVSKVAYFGYLFDPLMTWVYALTRGSNRVPGYQWLSDAYHRELAQDYGQRSFNMAVCFQKPLHASERISC